MDDDGAIDDYEFICALALFTRTTKEERIEAIFNLFDEDRSQFLQQDEFMTLIRTILATRQYQIEVNRPTKSQFEALVEEKFMEMQKEFQLTDGAVTLADFKRMVFEEEEFALVLHGIGVLDSDEFEQEDYDNDLDAELNKSEIERDDDYEERKQGTLMEEIPEEAEEAAAGGGLFQVEEVDAGEQFMAVKPWVGTVRASEPSGYAPTRFTGKAPDSKLELEYVYGYRCHDTRNNIRYSANGNVVYHTAAVGIVLDPFKNEQKFLLEHGDDIMCLANYENLFVTGEVGKEPLICIWDADKDEPTPIAANKGLIEGGISHVAFSWDGNFIAAVGMDDENTIFIFDVKAMIKLGNTKAKVEDILIMKGRGPREDILDIEFAKGLQRTIRSSLPAGRAISTSSRRGACGAV